MSLPNLDDVSAVALAAAREAGDRIKALRESGQIDISFKSEKDLVTNADLEAEAIIIRHIRHKFPDHGLLTEESAPNIEAANLHGPLWIIDPIDGTANFAHNHYQVGVSIAFAYEGKLQVGVVNAPFVGEIFHAIRGRGASVNQTPIAPRKIEKLNEAIVATGFPGWAKNTDLTIAQMRLVLDHCRDMRRLGSAALDVCWVAMGRLDGYWETVKPWDIAAAALIAREAGAKTGFTIPRSAHNPIPEEFDSHNFYVAAPAIFEKLAEVLTLPIKGA